MQCEGQGGCDLIRSWAGFEFCFKSFPSMQCTAGLKTLQWYRLCQLARGWSAGAFPSDPAPSSIGAQLLVVEGGIFCHSASWENPVNLGPALPSQGSRTQPSVCGVGLRYEKVSCPYPCSTGSLHLPWDENLDCSPLSSSRLLLTGRKG